MPPAQCDSGAQRRYGLGVSDGGEPLLAVFLVKRRKQRIPDLLNTKDKKDQETTNKNSRNKKKRRTDIKKLLVLGVDLHLMSLLEVSWFTFGASPPKLPGKAVSKRGFWEKKRC